MHYRMLGIDLDGTLLGPGGKLAERDAAAVAEAQAAGVLVVPCTGRGWREARAGLSCMRGDDPGVFACGAVINHIASGRSLELAVIEPQLAMEVVDLIKDAPDAVLVFRDATVVGHDYLVTGDGTLGDLRHTLRVGMVAPGERVAKLAEIVRQAMGERVFVQSFTAVPMPDDR